MRGQQAERRLVRFHPRRRVVLTLAVAAAVCLILTLFVGRQLEIGRRRRSLLDLEQAQASASTEQTALREQLGMADDLETLEMLARERLGLVMPGEEKVIFVQESGEEGK
jgi:cell division protein FtsB